jgi:nonsense-mediated mRNA decay protein 3
MDIHTSTKSYKFSFSCELVPICKDDLVALPLKLARSIGSISPVAVCHRVGTSIQLLDPNTLQVADVSAPVYWRSPFTSLADVQELTEFVVMDIEPLGPTRGRYALAEATVARSSDLGSNSTTYFTRTHLGNLLHPGDTVLGYHLAGTNFNNPQFEALEMNSSQAAQIPDVMLVKKHYARKKKAKTNRNWKLKRMARDEGEMLPKKQDQERLERDYEMFLREVEEDAELRNTLAVYKAQEAGRRKAEKMEGVVVEETEKEKEAAAMDEGADVEETDDDDADDDDVPQIAMEELLDEFDELDIKEKA